MGRSCQGDPSAGAAALVERAYRPRAARWRRARRSAATGDDAGEHRQSPMPRTTCLAHAHPVQPSPWKRVRCAPPRCADLALPRPPGTPARHRRRRAPVAAVCVVEVTSEIPLGWSAMLITPSACRRSPPTVLFIAGWRRATAGSAAAASFARGAGGSHGDRRHVSPMSGATPPAARCLQPQRFFLRGRLLLSQWRSPNRSRCGRRPRSRAPQPIGPTGSSATRPSPNREAQKRLAVAFLHGGVTS